MIFIAMLCMGKNRSTERSRLIRTRFEIPFMSVESKGVPAELVDSCDPNGSFIPSIQANEIVLRLTPVFPEQCSRFAVMNLNLI